ncbi:MAG: LPS export ABC transporter periplasmic protein LptC [Gammaproteobacteria bacterium]|nr:LPS export ABC transporter periplasmic protein LptC [Gammaproteobacteria bacterium]MDH5653644.1 LPS export ABC transporter periplasmic protein LptC [Gammaproteobacteria bacterium]
MGKFRFLILFVLIIGGAVFTSWLLKSLDEQQLDRKAVSEHEADYFLEGFTATAFDPAGKPSYRLEAALLQHYPISNVVKLQKPYIEFFTDHPQPWQTWAEQGTLHEKNRRVELTGKVRIHRAGGKDELPITLLTDTLYINTSTKLAETEARVNITRGKDEIFATGMRIDMLKDKLELMSKVEGKYAVP